MDDDSMVSKSKMKTEATNKVKDGYSQLAEKMEQVKSQMAKMERKYDELYQTVKEREHGKTGSISSDQVSPEEGKSQRESVVEATSSAKHSIASENSLPPSSTPEKTEDPKPNDLDIEKMESNPFV